MAAINQTQSGIGIDRVWYRHTISSANKGRAFFKCAAFGLLNGQADLPRLGQGSGLRFDHDGEHARRGSRSSCGRFGSHGPPPQPAMANASSTAMDTSSRRRCQRFCPSTGANANPKSSSHWERMAGLWRLATLLCAVAAPVVCTVNVTVMVSLPSKALDVGVTAQVAALGAPEQARLTGPVSPFSVSIRCYK